jgi:hypothetical protein
MTKASLSRALGIRLCEDLSHRDRRCLGILLHYEDGSIEALGQVRWDKNISSETIPIQEFEYRLHLGQRPFVTCRGRSHWTLEGLEEEEHGWKNVPTSGTIVWWFCSRGDRLVTC